MTKNKYIGLGLMSGTSLDGLDIVAAEFIADKKGWKYKLIDSHTAPYPEKLLHEVNNAIKDPLSDHSELNLLLAQWMGNESLAFISNLDEAVDFISSHGQTIYHNPGEGLTIQLGDGQIISDICDVTVVNDFRTQDVHLGGQGAPLVPIGDLHLFNEFEYCLNLGGIANISIKEGGIKAFDICICNAGINALVNKIGMPFDEGGKIGEKGKILPDLLIAWNSLEYMSKKAPKSLDAAYFQNAMWSEHIFGKYSVEDCIRTLYEHLAIQISNVISERKKKILVTGGGAYNDFLIHLMMNNYQLDLHIPGKELIEFKEALIFAFLGLLRIRGEVNVLSAVTGSGMDHSAGIIHKK